MAWNRPTGADRTAGRARRTSRHVRAVVAAGAAVAVCALAASLLLRRDGAAAAETPRARLPIPDAAPDSTPDVSGTSPEASAARPTPAPRPRPPQRVGELRDGYRLLCDGTLHRVVGIVTNSPGKFSLADRTFRHSADVELGNLLTVEPGDDLLGDGEGMYRGFAQELEEALAEPIVYGDGDTDLQRELKAGVIELRDELKRRMDSGEDVERIMEDTRRQLKELALYREELHEQVMRLSSSEMSEADYKNLVAAANRMLAERGVKPLEVPATLRRALRIRKAREAAAAREQEKRHED